jgi:Abortive infection C-terminus
MTGLTGREIMRVVNDYIGVSGGYLGDFSYRTHAEFYPYYCELDVDPNEEPGTTRERFIAILKRSTPSDQAKILRGVLSKYPPSLAGTKSRTEALKADILGVVARLEAASPIASPSPRITSEVVERAIADAETLMQTSGASSGVDRIHTALHGYLLAACEAEGMAYGTDPSLTDVFKLLKHGHPALAKQGPRDADITQILRSISSIMDALNPVRNRASVAHPNRSLLAHDEAMLTINVARTLLHYLDAKFSAALAPPF